MPWTAMRLQKLPPWEDSEEDLSSDAPRSSTFLGLCAPSRGFIVIDRVMSMIRKNSDEANHGGKPHRSRLVCITLLRSCTRLTCCEQKRASFSAAAMVNNLEFALAPDTMISRDTTWPMLVMAFLGLDGSTVYPAVLYGPEDMASPPLSPGRPRAAPTMLRTSLPRADRPGACWSSSSPLTWPTLGHVDIQPRQDPSGPGLGQGSP